MTPPGLWGTPLILAVFVTIPQLASGAPRLARPAAWQVAENHQ
jgi:hypothetical protein